MIEFVGFEPYQQHFYSLLTHFPLSLAFVICLILAFS